MYRRFPNARRQPAAWNYKPLPATLSAAPELGCTLLLRRESPSPAPVRKGGAGPHLLEEGGTKNLWPNFKTTTGYLDSLSPNHKCTCHVFSEFTPLVSLHTYLLLCNFKGLKRTLHPEGSEYMRSHPSVLQNVPQCVWVERRTGRPQNLFMGCTLWGELPPR